MVDGAGSQGGAIEGGELARGEEEEVPVEGGKK